MSHLSLFEEEEILHAPTMMPVQQLQDSARGFSTSTTSRLQYYEPGPSTRKRTVTEALLRANKASPLLRRLKRIPFTRPYAYALQGLTVGLILVDPLDRLEGGLID